MSLRIRTCTAGAATVLAFAAIPGTIVLIHTPGVANADVCASVRPAGFGVATPHRGRSRTLCSAAGLLRSHAV